MPAISKPKVPLTVLAAGAAAALALCVTAAGAPAAAATQDVQRCGNESGRVLLSLDDWAYGDPERAVRTGAYLRDEGIRAAFFLVNEFASEYPEIIDELRAQGHWVGNHTWSHARLTDLSSDAAAREIEDGVASTLLRPPYGAFGSRETSIAADLGYRICTWTVDTEDWRMTGGTYRSPDEIRGVVRDASEGELADGVILGHLQTRFPDALPGIIADLRDRGYELCRNTGPVGAEVPLPLDC